MKLQTIVETGTFTDKISYRDKIMFLGSCFATEIGTIMKRLRFKSEVNPFGPLYNPSSIASSLERLAKCIFFKEEELLMQGDICKSLCLSSEFAAPSKELFLRENNSRLVAASKHFCESRWIVLTFGTKWIYTENSTGTIAANCHKLPRENFVRSALTINQVVEQISPFIEQIRDKKWLLTVSPIRHWKDGAHGNQLSKATLLLAVEELVNRYENALYFPAYEILLDQLRDYRFYAADMLHPSEQATQYIWERFRDSLIDPSNGELMKIVSKLNSMEDHRPIFPFSGDYRNFENELKSLRNEVEQEFTKMEESHNL